MGYQPTRSKPGERPPFNVGAKSKKLLRCDYCDMAYDGSKHVNCPHCLAPRPSNGGRERQGAVLYSDDVPYLRIEVQNGCHSTLMTPNERRERLGLKKLDIPDPYGTVERR